MHDPCDWSRAKRELSEASKLYGAWKAMPDHVRSQISALEYRRRCVQVRQALKRADDLCRSASLAARQAARPGSQRRGAAADRP